MEQVLTSKYMNPLADYGFKAIFGNESRKELLIDFLNELIKEQGRIVDLSYLPTEQLGRTQEDRKAIFDLYCKTERDEYFIVELQNVRQVYFKDRSVFYSTFPIQSQAKRGEWNFKLQAVYTIAILDFNLLDDKSDKFHHEIKLMDTETNKVFYDKLTYIYVELPKFKLSGDLLTTDFERWIYLLKHLSVLKNRPPELRGRIFDKLFAAAEIGKLTKEEMEKYNKSILEYNDVRNALKYAEELGREEGIELGMQKGMEKGIETEKLEIAKRCLSENMSIEIISKLTGLTPDQIKELD